MSYIQSLRWEQSRIHERKDRTRIIHPNSGVSPERTAVLMAASLMVLDQLEY